MPIVPMSRAVSRAKTSRIYCARFLQPGPCATADADDAVETIGRFGVAGTEAGP
jgi:hypothetical protein